VIWTWIEIEIKLELWFGLGLGFDASTAATARDPNESRDAEKTDEENGEDNHGVVLARRLRSRRYLQGLGLGVPHVVRG
jgi:hypothetical protein